MHHRIPRVVGALGLAISLTIGTLAGSTVAATAPLIVTGSNLSPTVVSWGGIGVFHLKAQNDPTQTSNISQLYLRENSGAAVYGYADPAPNPWCSAVSSPLTCSFGSLSPGQAVEFTVALTAPSSGTTWNVDFEFSTNGFTTTGKKSRGGGDPSFHLSYSVSLASTSDSTDKAGTYVWDTTQQSQPVHNGLRLGQSNPQSTSVTSPATGIAVSVQDGISDFPADQGCTSTLEDTCPTAWIGQVSIIEVGGDQAITNQADCLAPGVWIAPTGCAFPAVIQYYRPGINPNQVNGVYHNWTDSDGFHQEWIHAPCASASAPGPTTPCFYAEKLGAQNLQITVWFFHNGNVRGW